MFEGAALSYGLLSMFILSSAERNRRVERAHPKMLVYCGWTLMGGSFAGSALLLAHAAKAAMGA